MAEAENRGKYVEVAFVAGFSALILALFFFLLGANGLVLGNDPAVHLQTAQGFLNAGRISISDIAWYPPLYHILLATFIAFTGATTLEQMLVVMKAFTALIDWLLVFSVYLIAAKFFNRKTGVLAAMILLLSFPLYEINSWGGYTSILSMAFMVLAFAYLAVPLKSAWSALVTFVFAFSVVMSHQLATFLSVFILPPFVVLVLAKSKGHYRKALIAALLGGGVAFGIYYLRPMLPYLGDLVNILFFQLKTMAYQIPTVSSGAFLMNFGFGLLLAFAGLAIGFAELRRRKTLSIYLLLVMAFLVPLILSQSYLVGIYLPFQWFVYYLMPFLAVFAGVGLAFLIDRARAWYFNHQADWRRLALKAIALTIAAALVAVMVARFDTVAGKIGESAEFYSISDMSAYQISSWIRDYPNPLSKVVVTERPGHWFRVYSGRETIAETDPVIEWNPVAECVLAFSYEFEHPLTMVRAYESKGNISAENYVAMNMAWTRTTYFPEDIAQLSYRDGNDTLRTFLLSDLEREIAFDGVHSPKKITIRYSAPEFALTESILVENDTYPVTAVWQLSALGTDLNYASLYLGEYFDSSFAFDKAYVPGLLNWENPWSNPSKVEQGKWAVTSFWRENLTGNSRVDVLDSRNQTVFGVNFLDTPDSGNLGALGNGNIDAVRWQYNFFRVEANYTITRTYQVLAFSGSSYPQLKDLTQINMLFGSKVSPVFEVKARNFVSLLYDMHIDFLVYDLRRFDLSILSSRWVDLVYSNDKYVVLKIKSDHPWVYIAE
ncbi:MAG: hypothetical protein ACE14S_06740 [Candidatus Bathyarchaeia archaeon]